MTTLTITPSWLHKTARFEGTVAAGERVAVTIAGGKRCIDFENAAPRLRVLAPNGKTTLAQFPEPPADGEEPETWEQSGENDAAFVLDLSKPAMMAAVRPGCPGVFLLVIDDVTNKTLYVNDLSFHVDFWPRAPQDNAGGDAP